MTDAAKLPCIYGLFDRDGNLRYVGKANDPRARLMSHMRDSLRRDTPVYRWIRKNGVPEMRVLSANCQDWKSEERRLIAEAKASGIALLNVADGGDEPFCPIEVRRANGRKTLSYLQSGKKPDGTDYTREEVVAYAYESALQTALKRNSVRNMLKAVIGMTEHFRESPHSYPQWKIYDKVNLDAARKAFDILERDRGSYRFRRRGNGQHEANAVAG